MITFVRLSCSIVILYVSVLTVQGVYDVRSQFSYCIEGIRRILSYAVGTHIRRLLVLGTLRGTEPLADLRLKKHKQDHGCVAKFFYSVNRYKIT